MTRRSGGEWAVGVPDWPNGVSFLAATTTYQNKNIRETRASLWIDGQFHNDAHNRHKLTLTRVNLWSVVNRKDESKRDGDAPKLSLILLCDHLTERVVFESFITSFASRAVSHFSPHVFKLNESKVAAAAAPLYGRKSVSKAVKSPLSYGAGGGSGPAEQKCESGIEIQLVTPHTARELRTRRGEL